MKERQNTLPRERINGKFLSAAVGEFTTDCVDGRKRARFLT